MRVYADCAGVRVTAAVSKSVYNELRIGQPATFHLRGGSEELEGRVTELLHGCARVPGNWAIEQTACAQAIHHRVGFRSGERTGLSRGPHRQGDVIRRHAGPVTAAAR